MKNTYSTTLYNVQFYWAYKICNVAPHFCYRSLPSSSLCIGLAVELAYTLYLNTWQIASYIVHTSVLNFHFVFLSLISKNCTMYFDYIILSSPTLPNHLSCPPKFVFLVFLWVLFGLPDGVLCCEWNQFPWEEKSSLPHHITQITPSVRQGAKDGNSRLSVIEHLFLGAECSWSWGSE